MFEPDAIGALDVERFDRQFAVNLRAPLFLAEAFAAQAGANANASIVNILDQRVFKLTPHFVSYTLGEKRAAFRNPHAGAGAGAERARQRGRAGADDRERTAARRGFRATGRGQCRSAMDQARRRSRRRWSIWRARAASPA